MMRVPHGETEKHSEILKALQTNSLALLDTEMGTKRVVTTAWGTSRLILRIERLAREVLQSKDTLFRVEPSSRGPGSLQYSRLGALILQCLKADPNEIRREFPMHKVNPYIALFMKAFSSPSLHELRAGTRFLTEQQHTDMATALNTAVATLRHEGGTPAFKKSQDLFIRRSNKNHKALNLYVDTLFKKYSRLLVIRLDFGYGRHLQDGSRPMNEETFSAVKVHWKTMQKAFKLQLTPPGPVGFAYKIEYGLQKGFHIHALLMYDGSKLRQDVTIARILGDYWKQEITRGKGVYYNCNAVKEKYATCGIGMVRHDDANARDGLHAVVRYMTKPDYYLAMEASPKARTFGKGNMPKTVNARGRPRESESRHLSKRPVLDTPLG